MDLELSLPPLTLRIPTFFLFLSLSPSILLDPSLSLSHTTNLSLPPALFLLLPRDCPPAPSLPMPPPCLLLAAFAISLSYLSSFPRPPLETPNLSRPPFLPNCSCPLTPQFPFHVFFIFFLSGCLLFPFLRIHPKFPHYVQDRSKCAQDQVRLAYPG